MRSISSLRTSCPPILHLNNSRTNAMSVIWPPTYMNHHSRYLFSTIQSLHLPYDVCARTGRVLDRLHGLEVKKNQLKAVNWFLCSPNECKSCKLKEVGCNRTTHSE